MENLGELAEHRDLVMLAVTALIAVAQIALFLWANGVYWREMTGRGKPGNACEGAAGSGGQTLSVGMA